MITKFTGVLQALIKRKLAIERTEVDFNTMN